MDLILRLLGPVATVACLLLGIALVAVKTENSSLKEDIVKLKKEKDTAITAQALCQGGVDNLVKERDAAKDRAAAAQEDALKKVSASNDRLANLRKVVGSSCDDIDRMADAFWGGR